MKLYLTDGTKTSTDPIADILRDCKTIAVVGLSSNPARPSHEVSAYMQSAGYRIIPVNPYEREVLGEKSYARLENVPEKVDLVNIFRRSEVVPPVIDSAIHVGAKVVWLQLGIESSAASEKVCASGILVVENACLFIEHKKRRPI